MQVPKIFNACLIFSALVSLLGCDPWRQFALRNPDTGAEAACAIHWGALSDEDVQRVRECISACEAKGFKLKSKKKVPEARPLVKVAKPASVPAACLN